jgi:hypothetical protein
MRRTLPLGNFQKKKEKRKEKRGTNVSVRDTNFANSNLANRKNTDFGSRLPDGILGNPIKRAGRP